MDFEDGPQDPAANNKQNFLVLQNLADNGKSLNQNNVLKQPGQMNYAAELWGNCNVAKKY